MTSEAAPSSEALRPRLFLAPSQQQNHDHRLGSVGDTCQRIEARRRQPADHAKLESRIRMLSNPGARTLEHAAEWRSRIGSEA